MWLAWHNRDLAHLWRLARLLGNREARRAQVRCSLTPEQWREGLSRQGSGGGFNASKIDDWDEWAHKKDSQHRGLEHSENARGFDMTILLQILGFTFTKDNFICLLIIYFPSWFPTQTFIWRLLKEICIPADPTENISSYSRIGISPKWAYQWGTVWCVQRES